MKKLYKLSILILPLLLTGCFGLSGQGYLINTCTKEEVSNNLKETSTYKIEFKEGVVNTVTITKAYTGNTSDITGSIQSYKAAYQKTKGINVETTDSSITYVIDMSKASDDTKDTFNLKDEYNKQITTLKNLGMECK